VSPPLRTTDRTLGQSESEDEDRVIAEYDEDDLDEDLFEGDDADAPPILDDDDTPMDKVLERLSWKDEGVINNDAKKSDQLPENITPAMRLQNMETCGLINWWFGWFPKSLLIKIATQCNIKAGGSKWPKDARWMDMWLLMVGVYPTSPRRQYWRGSSHSGST
jgi:hypothetical protein